jgi:uncharacterized protein
MNCPVCESVKLVMSERQGIEIDYCPQCRGVWLDRGELDKLIDRSPGNTIRHDEDSVPREYRERPDDSQNHHDSYRRGYPRKKKREGFLSDLFDFD